MTPTQKRYDELWSFDGVEYTHAQASKDCETLYPVIKQQFHASAATNAITRTPVTSRASSTE